MNGKLNFWINLSLALVMAVSLGLVPSQAVAGEHTPICLPNEFANRMAGLEMSDVWMETTCHKVPRDVLSSAISGSIAELGLSDWDRPSVVDFDDIIESKSDINSDGYLIRVTRGESNTKHSTSPSINADGTKVVFQSLADFLNQGDILGSEIWLFDLNTQSLNRITTTPPPGQNNEPSISGDGLKITFVSDYDFNKQRVYDSVLHIWVYDVSNNRFARVTNDATSLGRPNRLPSISGDGTTIAFYSKADLLNEGLGANMRIWLYDLGNAYSDEFDQ